MLNGVKLVLTQGHRFVSPAFPAVNRNSFAVKMIRQPIRLIHARLLCPFGEIYRLADRGIAVFLEAGLHTDVPLRRNIIGAFENITDFSGNLAHFLNTAGFEDLPGQFLAVKTVLYGDLFKYGIDL